MGISMELNLIMSRCLSLWGCVPMYFGICVSMSINGVR